LRAGADPCQTAPSRVAAGGVGALPPGILPSIEKLRRCRYTAAATRGWPLEGRVARAPLGDRMAQVHLPLAPQRSFGQTSRRDAWWLNPLLVFLGLTAFIVYVSWAGMQNDHYWYGGYLSPVYSPELWGKSPHAVFGGPKPPWWPAFLTGPFA